LISNYFYILVCLELLNVSYHNDANVVIFGV